MSKIPEQKSVGTSVGALGKRVTDLERAVKDDGVESLYLWSSWDDGDSNVTIPAYPSGSWLIDYQHMVPATLPAWATAVYAGSPATVPPINTVVVDPGFYFVDAWWLFTDDGNVAWLGAQLNLYAVWGSTPNRNYAVTAEVDATGAHSVGNDPQDARFTGQFDTAHTLYVPDGAVGVIETGLFHNDAHTIDLRANWTLGIHKLS